jgi:predicted amidohydrolase YtcJ
VGTNEEADLILFGGNVITVAPGRPRAEAIAIRNGKILCVGTNGEVREKAGKGSLQKDLRGMTVVPGFIESHNHTLMFGINRQGVDLSRVRSIREMIHVLKDRAAQREPGTWVVGAGYNQHELEEKRHPTRWDLDEVSSLHPVLIKHTSAHARVVSSRVLAMAGITRDTLTPEGGRIDRDDVTGEPTGVLFQFSAMNLVDRLLPKLTGEDLTEALRQANQVLLAQGITSAVDGGTTLFPFPVYFSAFQDAVERGALEVRHTLVVRSDMLVDWNNPQDGLKHLEENLMGLGIHPGAGNERLRVGPFKFIPDGAISTGTAATYDPYGADPVHQSTGELMISPEALAEIASEAHHLGFQLMVHAIGDRAVDAAIQGIELALHRTPRRDARPRIEHCVMVTAQALQKMRGLGIVAVVQPAFLWGLGDNWISQLGPERARKLKPLRAFLNNQVVMAFGSDRPVVNGSPLLGIHTAVNQKTMNGNDYAPEEKITVEEALRCYTIHGAYATFEDGIKGSIEPGKLADLAILAENPINVPREHIKDIEIVATLVGGKICHGSL